MWFVFKCFNTSYMSEDDVTIFQLLDHEVSPTRQVPLLLDMMKYESALDKAITSGDPELGTRGL